MRKILLAAALVWLALDVVERRRVMSPRAPLLSASTATAIRLGASYFVTTMLAVLLLWQDERLLRRVAAESSLP